MARRAAGRLEDIYREIGKGPILFLSLASGTNEVERRPAPSTIYSATSGQDVCSQYAQLTLVVVSSNDSSLSESSIKLISCTGTWALTSSGIESSKMHRSGQGSLKNRLR